MADYKFSFPSSVVLPKDFRVERGSFLTRAIKVGEPKVRVHWETFWRGGEVWKRMWREDLGGAENFTETCESADHFKMPVYGKWIVPRESILRLNSGSKKKVTDRCTLLKAVYHLDSGHWVCWKYAVEDLYASMISALKIQWIEWHQFEILPDQKAAAKQWNAYFKEFSHWINEQHTLYCPYWKDGQR